MQISNRVKAAVLGVVALLGIAVGRPDKEEASERCDVTISGRMPPVKTPVLKINPEGRGPEDVELMRGGACNMLRLSGKGGVEMIPLGDAVQSLDIGGAVIGIKDGGLKEINTKIDDALGGSFKPSPTPNASFGVEDVRTK